MTEVAALTREDILALKLADSVSFHYVDGVGKIYASLENREGRIFSAKEQKLFPATDRLNRDRVILVHTEMSGYRDGGDSHNWRLDQYPKAAAFASIIAPRFDPEWQTTVYILRPGDTLTLIWTADNNTETIRKASLHTDTLHMDIRRSARLASDPAVLRFHVDTRISLDNSARMIRRYGY